MKKLITSVFLYLSFLCLTACSAPIGSNTVRENRLGLSFSSSVIINIDKLTAEGTITKLEDGKWVAEFESPNTLSGVKLSFNEGNVTADYKGLTFSVPRSALPVKSMLCNLIEAVDGNARESELRGKEKDGMFEINGSLEGGEYTLSLDNSGYIKSFDMPNNLLHITFTDVQISTGDISVSTESTTTYTNTTTIPVPTAEG